MNHPAMTPEQVAQRLALAIRKFDEKAAAGLQELGRKADRKSPWRNSILWARSFFSTFGLAIVKASGEISTAIARARLA